MWENGLIRTLRLVLKFITSKTGPQTITIHIFLNISSRKGHPVMEFSQLVKYNSKNIFDQRSCRRKLGQED